jgi:hypothetical protein
MSRRTTTPTSIELPLPTEVLAEVDELNSEAAEPATESATESATEQLPTPHRRASRRRPPAGLRRPALYLAVAVAGGIMVNVLTTGQPDAQAGADQPVSVAAQLGLSSQRTDTTLSHSDVGQRLGQLAANRSQREAEQAAAAQSQAAADQAVIDAQAAAAAKAAADAQAAAEAKAAEEAAAAAAASAASAAKAAEQQAAAESVPASSGSRSSAGSGSYQDYALAQLGGDTSEFSCLESLWGKESGWNPNAQNPSSSAYGIPQFLDSTWKGTGIAKTSDGYRQIDAGLVYIDSRYGSPCGAWSHSKSTGWY